MRSLGPFEVLDLSEMLWPSESPRPRRDASVRVRSLNPCKFLGWARYLAQERSHSLVEALGLSVMPWLGRGVWHMQDVLLWARCLVRTRFLGSSEVPCVWSSWEIRVFYIDFWICSKENMT